MHFVVVADLVVAGFLVGANAWFFFIQSPALIAIMGREKFVPLQMRLTKLLFQNLSTAALLLVVFAWLAGPSGAILGAAIAAIAALIAQFAIISRALKAGGKGRIETMAEGGYNSVGKLASEGSGPSAKFWHRTVVVFVGLVLIGAVINIDGIVR